MKRSRQRHRYQYGGLHQSRQITKLWGADQFTFFNDPVYEKKILLVGEYHTYSDVRDEPYEVHKWAYDLAKNAPECLDIFIERPYLVEESWENLTKIGEGYEIHDVNYYDMPLISINDSLEAIQGVFKECYMREKLRCREIFPNLRYHYADVRILSNSVISPALLIYVKLSHMTSEEFDETSDTIYKYLLTLDMSQYAVDTFDHYIRSGFSQLEDTYLDIEHMTEVFENYPSYMKKYFEIIQKELSKLPPDVDRSYFLQTFFNVYKEHYGSIDLITGAAHLPQDLYVMIRIFIQFKEVRRISSSSACHNVMRPKNIIIFAGIEHTQLYKRFLEQILERKPLLDIYSQRDPDSEAEEDKKFVKLQHPFDMFK